LAFRGPRKCSWYMAKPHQWFYEWKWPCNLVLIKIVIWDIQTFSWTFLSGCDSVLAVLTWHMNILGMLVSVWSVHKALDLFHKESSHFRPARGSADIMLCLCLVFEK
jgi:hypothetical protein